MRKGWNIRKAKPEDSENLQKCMESAYASYQAKMGEERLPPLDTDYLNEIINFPTWVAEANGKIVGGLTMTFENNSASIANIAVHSEYQGQGLGRALTYFAELIAKERKHSELCLVTHVLLSENISLYFHLGWKEVGRDFVRVYMKKDI